MAEPWSGVVLTGGRSTRMGRDKALLPVEGKPMALRVADALRAAGAIDVVCIGGDRDALATHGLRTIDDEHPNDGPLGAFITALHWSGAPITVVSPCDLLTPTASSFTRLAAALSASDALAAVPVVDGKVRSMPAALRSICAATLETAFATGERAAYTIVHELRCIEVDAGPLMDADRPEELGDHR